MMAVMGILMALVERNVSGEGQVVDCSMTAGASYLSSFLDLSRSMKYLWSGGRGENLLDGGAPFYDTYETLDGKYMAVGALEPQFFQQLIQGLGVAEGFKYNQHDRSDWHDIRCMFAARFKEKTQCEWTKVFGNVDACVTPVLERADAPFHQNNIDNESFMSSGIEGDFYSPSPSPLLSRTPAIATHRASPQVSEHTVEVLKSYLLSEDEIALLLAEGVVEQRNKSKL